MFEGMNPYNEVRYTRLTEEEYAKRKEDLLDAYKYLAKYDHKVFEAWRHFVKLNVKNTALENQANDLIKDVALEKYIHKRDSGNVVRARLTNQYIKCLDPLNPIYLDKRHLEMLRRSVWQEGKLDIQTKLQEA